MKHNYTRHGTNILFAILNMFTAEVIGKLKKHHRRQEFLLLLEASEMQIPKKKAPHVIVDNYATHRRATVNCWFKRNPRVVMRLMPTILLWLYMVERLFELSNEKADSPRDIFSAQDLKLYRRNISKSPRFSPCFCDFGNR